MPHIRPAGVASPLQQFEALGRDRPEHLPALGPVITPSRRNVTMSDSITRSEAGYVRTFGSDTQQHRARITAALSPAVVTCDRGDAPNEERAPEAIAASEVRYRRLFEA